MSNFLGRYSDRIYPLTHIVVGFLYACHGAQKLFGVLGGQRELHDLGLLAGLIEFFCGSANRPWIGRRRRGLHRERRNGSGILQGSCASRIVADYERRRTRGFLLLLLPLRSRAGVWALQP